MANYLAGKGVRDGCKTRNRKEIRYAGRFQTNGAAPATNSKGWGVVSIVRNATGKYKITLDRAFAEILYINARLAQVTSLTQDVIIIDSTIDPGDFDTPASFEVETHSAIGTEANLTGPIVMWELVGSSIATDYTTALS
jgi:hypothetical protein